MSPQGARHRPVGAEAARREPRVERGDVRRQPPLHRQPPAPAAGWTARPSGLEERTTTSTAAPGSARSAKEPAIPPVSQRAG